MKKKLTEGQLRVWLRLVGRAEISMSKVVELINEHFKSIYETKVFISYFDCGIVEEYGIEDTKKSIIDDIKKDHTVLDDTAEWHICACGAECKIILIIQAKSK